MTNNTRKAIHACLLLLAILFGACVKDSMLPESKYEQPQDFRLADAKDHYEENVEHLSFPEIYLKSIIQTKGSEFFHNLEQTPLWEQFHYVENRWSYIYEIPVLYNITLKTTMGYFVEDGKMIKEDKAVKLQTNLIIQKYKASGNVKIFLTTIIGYIPNPDEEQDCHSPWLWTGDRRNFIGYQFFTNTDGSLRSAFQYKNAHRTNIALNLYDKYEEYTYPQAYFSITFDAVSTKGEGITVPDITCWNCGGAMVSEDFYCLDCGAGTGELGGIIVTPNPDHPNRCSTCNFLMENCVCWADDDSCPYCHLPDCSGECRDTGGDGAGDGGSTTPGGNQGEDGENSSVKYETINGLYVDSLLLDNGMTRTREILHQLESDCMATALMSAIYGTKVIACDTLGNDVARFDPNTRTIKINIDMWQEDINILEEMIHALQKKNGNYISVEGQPNNRFNLEVEAKIALFRYLKKCGKANMMPVGYHVQWDSLVSKYLETGSIEDYDAIAIYFRTESQNSGYIYGDTAKYQEMEGYKNIDNTRNLFNCDDYNNYN